MASLFAHGVSGGEVGTSPAEAGSPKSGGTAGAGAEDGASSSGSDSSDGGGELAETGTELSGPLALAALTLTAGAGLLWHHRRRES